MHMHNDPVYTCCGRDHYSTQYGSHLSMSIDPGLRMACSSRRHMRATPHVASRRAGRRASEAAPRASGGGRHARFRAVMRFDGMLAAPHMTHVVEMRCAKWGTNERAVSLRV